MGTRVNYDIIGEKGAGCILYTNNSHPEVDPEAEFMRLVGETIGATALVECCLELRYTTYGGNHRPGERVFWIDLEPEDRELVYRIGWDNDKPNVMKSTDFPPPPPFAERVKMAAAAAMAISSAEGLESGDQADTDETVRAIIDMIKNGHMIFYPPQRFGLTSTGFALNVSLG